MNKKEILEKRQERAEELIKVLKKKKVSDEEQRKIFSRAWYIVDNKLKGI